MRDLKVGSLASLTEVVECAPITCMSAMHHHLPNYTSLAREDHVRRFAEREGGRVSRTLPSSPHLAVNGVQCESVRVSQAAVKIGEPMTRCLSPLKSSMDGLPTKCWSRLHTKERANVALSEN